MSTMASPIPWDKADKGQVHQVLIQHVQRIEREQSDMYDRFIKLARLYDPNSDRDNSSSDKLGNVTENVCASNVDTVCAAIAATDVRSRFMTDGANWAMQRIARHLEWYAAEVSADLGVAAKCRKAFKSSPIKGTALNKVYIDSFDRVCVEPTRADDIIVDESDLRPDGRERELHQRMMCTAEDLIAEFPDKEDAINRAAQKGRGLTRMWADYRPVPQGRVVVLETWKPPIGVKGRKGYKPGRHMKVIDGEDLLDETWEEDFCPFAKMVWSEKEDGWFGISGLERIAGHQRVINKGNWQTDRLIDQFAVPTTFVDMANASIAVKATNRLGTIAVTKNGFIPKTVHPPAVSPEVYKRTADMKNSAFEEFGVSRLAAQSAKPAGIDSGIALREYRDQTTQRFSLQEKAFEKFVLDTVLLVLWCCKKLGKKAPTIMRHTRFGSKRIKWQDVDMRDTKVQIQAASTLSQTPAGRVQSVIEYAQAGIISQDEARDLLQHPDLEAALSLYTAALEDVEYCLDEIADGNVLMPEPFQNLAMVVWRSQQEYLRWRDDGAPEEILEALRQFIVQAAWMLKKQQEGQAGAANENADPSQMPAMPDAPPTSAPVAALAPQAMQLRAS
jgi:hypothetical protein